MRGPGIHCNVQSRFNLISDSLLSNIKKEEGKRNEDCIVVGVCVCVHSHCFEFCFLVYFIVLEDLPTTSRGFFFFFFCRLPKSLSKELPSPTSRALYVPSSARMLPSWLYYAVIVFALLSKMLFVTLEDLPLFQNLFSLCDPLWSNRVRELPTLPYRWSLFSLPPFFSDTLNN